VNKIPFFFTLSHKICFTAVNHLADRTVPQIFKAFKEMYQCYLQRGFHITTVHDDGEFAPIKTLIEAMPGGLMVNLASVNEHTPEDDDDHLSGVGPVMADDIEITGVDVEGTETQDAVPAPQVEIDDFDIHHADPAPIEVAPTQAAPITETPAPVALPAQAPELCRSTRVRSQTNQRYTPSLSGSKYSYAVTQLKSQ
jgi:hypothetical protein